MDSQQATRLDTPPFSVARFICEGYEQDPFKQMVVGMNEGITYAEAYRRMVALAGFLRREQGVGEGDTVMIAAPNIVAYFVLIGAIQLAGATVALMSPTVERAEFAGIYDRVHPAVAIVSTEAHCRLAAECSPATKVMTATCPVDGVLSVEQAWRGSAAWDGPSFDEDPKFVLFTSGSTGTPKAVQLRGSSFCRHAGELTRALRVKPGEVFFIPVPFAHVYGVVALHTALSHHATVATLVKYRPEQAMSLVTSVQANVYLGVSTMYLRELREMIWSNTGSLDNQETLLKASIKTRQEQIKTTYADDQRFSRKLDDEISQQQRINSWTKDFTSNYVGIVSFYLDGYEYALTSQTYQSFTPTQVRQMVRGQVPDQDDALRGKTTLYRIVQNGSWNVLFLSADKDWNPVNGQTYQLKLGRFDSTQVSATVESFSRSGGELLVRLRVESDVHPVLYMRSTEATLGENMDTFRVPERALYVQNETQGIVVVEGQTESFHPISVLTKADGYIYFQPVQQGLLYEGLTVKLF